MSKTAFFVALGLTSALSGAACSSNETPPSVESPATVGDAQSEEHEAASVVPEASTRDVENDASVGADVISDVKEEPNGLEFAPPYPVVTYPKENPKKPEIAMLGKILFWEERIGKMDNLACGTCHRSKAGGSNPRASEPASLNLGIDKVAGTPDDVRGGRGVVPCSHATHMPIADAGTVARITARKPPTYLDAMFYPAVFWDGRAGGVFKDPVDGVTVVICRGSRARVTGSGAAGQHHRDGVRANLGGYRRQDCYGGTAVGQGQVRSQSDGRRDQRRQQQLPQSLSDRWGSPDVTASRIIMSIANHERTLTSDNTPWDNYNGGERGTPAKPGIPAKPGALSDAQVHGLRLFNTKARCNLCHQPPLFSGDAARGPGIPMPMTPDGEVSDGFHNVGFLDPSIDPGQGKGRMKTPSLRNVGLREAGGLMHNGTGPGATLGDVLNAYKAGGQVATDRDPLMLQLDLTTAELADLAEFVRNGLTDARVKDEQPPFDRPLQHRAHQVKRRSAGGVARATQITW